MNMPPRAWRLGDRRVHGAAGGAVMAVTSMSCVQLGLALSVHLFGRLGPLGVVALRLAWAGVLSGLAISMPVAGVIAMLAASRELGRVTWPLLLTMLALAAIHPVLPFSLEFLALRRLTASAFGTLMSLEPAIALLAGLLALRQIPGTVSSS